MENSDFLHGNYDAIEIPDNAFIYCDPPYANTKKYATDFNNERFWDWCREIIETKENIKLLISEYNAPDDFVCIWSKGAQNNMGNNTMSKNEKLFIHNSQVSKFDLSSLTETISISRADIMEMVKKSVRRILKESNLDELQAWHGTVADFMRFSNSFAGSGEGSQVYGDGVYLTNVKDTGRWYAATIALKKATKGSNEIKTLIGYLNKVTHRFDLLKKITTENFPKIKQEILGKLYAEMEAASKPDTKVKFEHLIKIVEPLNASELKNLSIDLTHRAAKDYKRYVLTVEAPDTGYIDWTNNDRQFLQDIFNKISQKFDTSHVDFNKVKCFGDMFEKLRGWINKRESDTREIIPQKQLSLFLSQLGYTGIRVPTGFKKGGDGRGENLIIFNADDVRIVKRENLQGREDF
jgi:hypothetical protein